MDRLAVFLIAIIPALTILSHVIVKARADWRSEPLWHGFVMGAVTAVVIVGGAAMLEMALNEAIKHATSELTFAAIRAFFAAALPEEVAKFVILVWIVERHVDVRRKQDILPLAVAVSLGFAALENLFYVSQTEDWRSIAALRALTAVPGHGVYGLIMGAMLTFARLSPDKRRRYLLMAMAIPVLTHAAYDFPLMAGESAAPGIWLFFVWSAVLTLMGLLAATLSNRALSQAAAVDGATKQNVTIRGIVAVGIGAAMMASGPPMTAFFIHAAKLPWLAMWGFIPMGILPALLGADLLWWSYRRRRAVGRSNSLRV